MKNKYSAENIQVLEGLEAVRKRPGMYIGSTDIVGLHHLIWEVLDNSIDEVMSGFASEIKITLQPNNVISIEDNGRGIPVDKNPKTKLSGVETVFTVLHAGGKFDSESYKVSGGLHGVGASVVNALSDWLVCQVKRDNKLFEAKFKDGGKIDKKLREIDSANSTGTKVIFHPDPLIFGQNEFNATTIKDRIRESAFLFKNLRITFIDEINKTVDTFHYPEGIVDYIKYINHSKRTIAPIVSYSDTFNEIDVDVAFQYTDDMDEIIISFANSVKTFDGGSHVQGFKLALTNVINNYARNQKLLKEKDKSLEPEDIREGIVAIVSVKVPEKWINYEGQTKNKLNTQEANDWLLYPSPRPRAISTGPMQ
ncbi:MAG: DNA topoisomerase IV subunit B, partial [Ureaplasma sp.]|nr:DNA topoisomerase IV subunit B [Ureaplasma sp.]